MRVHEIKKILGGDISKANTKMPGTTFGLSTDYCNVGGKLRDKEGSVCHDKVCYACKLEKLRPSVKQGWTKRTLMVHEAMSTTVHMEQWVNAFVYRLKMMGYDEHRWHDGGDIQGYLHLWMIVAVAKATPEINHWLPTKEKEILMRYLKGGFAIPDNLCIRLSAPMVDKPLKRKDIPTSVAINKDFKVTDEVVCPAKWQGNACHECRACWDDNVQIVAYPTWKPTKGEVFPYD